MSKTFVNILLLGETGVGKSTFINALANFILHGTLEEALSNKLMCLVPSKFVLTDDDFNEKVIQIGSHSDETQTPGVSATQNPRSYVFYLNDYTLRIIDTPGMGDTRGIEFDEFNADKLMNYISGFDYLSAICIMLKPNNSKLSVFFEFCIKYILARLDKQALNNIIFLYTNSRSSHYKPGDTHKILKKLLEDIGSMPPFVTIPYNVQNTFCIDNEGFRYLAACSQGITFSEHEREHYNKSWEKSKNTCQRLINYILTLPKLPLVGTVTINESRRIIGKLAIPLGDMVVHVQRAIARLEEHKEDLADTNLTVQQLQEKLYIPTTNYRLRRITMEESTEADGCHFDIGYTFPITVFVRFGYGKQIQHKYHTEEIMEPFQDRVLDTNIQNQIVSKENAKKIAEKQIDETTAIINEYLTEANFLVDAAAKFMTFLKENAIVVFNDVFEAHFLDILQRERSISGLTDSQFVKNLEEILKKYREKKQNVHNVSPKDIYELMNGLFSLKNSGAELKKYHDLEDDETYSFNVNNDKKVFQL